MKCKYMFVSLLPLLLCGSILFAQNKDNLPALMNWVIPHLDNTNSDWSIVGYVEFQGYWVEDKHTDKPTAPEQKSLYKCYKKRMTCDEVDVTTGMLVITLSSTPIKEWNAQRIIIEDDDISPTAVCPILNTTVVDIEHQRIRSFDVPLTGRWKDSCKSMGYTPEVATDSATLAGVGNAKSAGTFIAY
jgi:hypothetical protein